MFIAYKCKMCGGSLEISDNQTVAICEYCGTKQTLPKLNNDVLTNLYERANHYRRNNEFDKASAIYEKILNEDNNDAEAYWSLVLCKYGIEYVEDPLTHKRIPTVNRTQYTSIFDDDNYLQAIKLADDNQKVIYKEEANTINEIQKGILAISLKEEPFDVFICYKETDNNGRRTMDSVLANDLYHQLTQEGFKVFFARITLEDKLGQEYEPYIFAALNSSKVMVVLGTKPEYFNAVWVKNEWSRYLSLVKQSKGSKILIPAYRDMDPYDLPEEFSHLQAQDMSKLGFMQDLIRGIKKIINVDEPKNTVIKETATIINNTSNAEITPLLKRAFIYLEDEEWDSGDEYLEKALNIDPENAEAYLGKLLIDYKLNSIDKLKDLDEPFTDNKNYQRILRYGDDSLKQDMDKYLSLIDDKKFFPIYNHANQLLSDATSITDYENIIKVLEPIKQYRDSNILIKSSLNKIDFIKQEEIRKKQELELQRLDGIYLSALNNLSNCKTEQDYKNAADNFNSIIDYKDSKQKADECLRLATQARSENLYLKATDLVKRDDISSLNEAINIFDSIIDYKDSKQQIEYCRNRIPQIKEEERLNGIYLKASSILNNAKSIKDYKTAINLFETIIDYKDSKQQIDNCNFQIEEFNRKKEKTKIDKEIEKAKSIYDKALKLQSKNDIGSLNKSIKLFETIKDYKDSKQQIEYCRNRISQIKEERSKPKNIKNKQLLIIVPSIIIACAVLWFVSITFIMPKIKYNKVMSLIDSGDYESGYAILEEIGNNDAILSNKYDRAMLLIDSEDYEQACSLLKDLNYKDSEVILNSIRIELAKELLSKPKIRSTIYFGNYEQDNDITNGKEDIEWLALDKQDDKALIISKYALDCQQYNTSAEDAVTWETCTLRKWLNNTFMNEAFSAEEQEMILTTSVNADKNPDYDTNPGNATEDKIFLLSIEEADKYFDSDEDRKCVATDYAVARGVNFTNCHWWLRSPGIYPNKVAIVHSDGYIFKYGIGASSGFVVFRPALWIDLES